MDGAEQAVPEGAGVLSWDAEGNPVSVVFSMDALREYDVRVRAEERQRIAALLTENAKIIDDFTRTGSPTLMIAYLIGLNDLAAGSAVPVATPPEPRCEHGKATPHTVDPTMEQIFWHEHPLCPGPVATPTDPVDEVKCPDCGATIRARMSDAPEVPVRQQQWYGRAGHCCDIDGNLWHQPGDCQSCHGDCCGYAVVPAAATSPAEQDGQR